VSSFDKDDYYALMEFNPTSGLFIHMKQDFKSLTELVLSGFRDTPDDTDFVCLIVYYPITLFVPEN